MNKKQKKVLIRIIVAVALLIILSFVPAEGWLQLALYMIPYLVIGYDILKKAVKGIMNRQVFDENFLMAVATVGAIARSRWRSMKKAAIITRPSPLCCSIRSASCSRAMR